MTKINQRPGCPGPVAERMEELLTRYKDFRDDLMAFQYDGDMSLISDSPPSEADLVDYGYLSRELENMLDDLRKECKARKETVGKILANRVTKRVLADPTLKLYATGYFARASPQAGAIPMLPKRNTPEYTELLNRLGFSGHAVEHGLATFNYRRLCEWIAEANSSGNPIPQRLVRSLPNPHCIFRKHISKNQ